MPAPAGGKKDGVPVAALVAVVVVVLVGAVAAVVLLAGGSSDDGSTNAGETISTSDPFEDPTDFGLEDEVDTLGTTPTTPATTTEPVSVPRRAFLNSGDAKLRTDPALGAGTVQRFTDVEGAEMTVLEEADGSGWYRVSIDGWEGYLFGSFVTPPSPGMCIATSVGATPVVYNLDTGAPLPDEKTGNKVLMTASAPDAHDVWPVVLPTGAHGGVPAADLTSVVCG